MFGAKKSDIKTDKWKEMKRYANDNDAMPDGAFFAMAEEVHNWDVEDWGWFAEVEELNGR